MLNCTHTWEPPAERISCNPSLSPTLQRDALWQKVFAGDASTQAGACLQLSWGQGDGEARTLQVQVDAAGQVFGKDPASGRYTAPLQLELPPSSQGKAIRFQLFVFGGDVQGDGRKQEELCQRAMAKPSYRCLQQSSKECWFYFAFRPTELENKLQTQPIFIDSTRTCQLFSRTETQIVGPECKVPAHLRCAHTCAPCHSSLFAGGQTCRFDPTHGKAIGCFRDGPGAQARFASPTGIALKSDGSLVVADASNHRLRALSSQAQVQTLAGDGRCAYDPSSGKSLDCMKDGKGDQAQFASPAGVAVDKDGHVYVADFGNHNIRKIAPDGTVTTFAGPGPDEFVENGARQYCHRDPKTQTPTHCFRDGAKGQAQFFHPSGLALGPRGALYVADTFNHKIRKISPDGVVSTLAGSTQGFRDGKGGEAQFSFPRGVVVDKDGSAYVADAGNHRIRKIAPDGTVSTLAGTGSQGAADGAATEAQFAYPTGLAIDAKGQLYVADQLNHKIRVVQPDGVGNWQVFTLAGDGQAGAVDGASSRESRLSGPTSLAVDAEGTVLYVTDTQNHGIRKIDIKAQTDT